ncbi:MAG: hypothetical protein K8R74_04230 [Bacteroidales bacterium]|nr:hypothetical protein [Bacteroidales bacterium]
MKRFISILSVFTLLFLTIGCNEDSWVDPVSPAADEQPSSLSKLTTRLNFTGTESFDAVSDPSCILDPGTVTPMGNKLIIEGFTIMSTATMEVEGMGVSQAQHIIVINAVWDNVTYSGPMKGTYIAEADGKPTWEGVYKGYRSKTGDNEWLGELELKAIGVGDFEGLVMKGTEKIMSDMPMPMRYTGTFEGQIIIPNPPM